MKKICWIIVSVILFPVLAYSQDHSQLYKHHHSKTRLKFDLGADAAFPIGSFSQDHSIGWGASMWFGYDLSEDVRVCFSTGYIDYLGSEPNVNDLGYVPVRFGVSYLPFTNFHIDANVGVGTFFTKKDVTAGFCFVPAVGYTFGDRVDFSVRYEGVTSSEFVSVIGFRLAYRIRI